MRARSYILLFLLLLGLTKGSAQNFWQPTGGPNGGRVRGIVANSAGDVFAGTINTGVFRQLNGGPVWTPVNTGVDTVVYSVAITPSGALLAGTARGVFRSVNNGASWSPTNLNADLAFSLAVKSSNEMYAGILNGNQSISRSTNDGITWAPVSLFGLSISSIAINPINGYIFAGTTTEGVYRSTDNGASWFQMTNGLNDLVIPAVAAAPNGTVFAGTQNNGVYLSTNNGVNWTPAGTGIPSPTIAVLAANSAGHIFAGIINGVFRSTNNGASWNPISTGLTDLQMQSLAFDTRGIGYAGTIGGLVFRTSSSTVPPLPPLLSSPANNSTDIPLNLPLVWLSSQGASTYHLQLSTTPTFSAIVLDDSTITDTTRPIGPLLNGTTYYWRVSGKNLGGVSAYSTARSFTTVPPPPPAPTLIAPSDGATNQPTTLTFSWNAVASATQYRLQVSSNAAFSAIVFDDSTIAGTSRLVTSLLNNTTYFWRVRGRNAGGPGPNSTVWSFTTIVTPPAAPTLLSPSDGATNQPTTLTLSWSASPGATSYRLQVSTNSAFTGIVFDDSTIAGTSRQVSSLLNFSTYFWRVNAKNIAGTSSYSAVWSFRTVGVPGFSLSSTSISFGNVIVNLSRQDSVTVTNTGTSALTISSVTSSNARFTVVPVSAGIPAQGTRTFFITFSPNAQGLVAGAVVFTHDAAGSPDTVSVNGTGVSSFFSATPSTLNFGNVATGATKRDSIRVANLGNPVINVSSVLPSDPQYTVTPQSASIPSGQSVWFYVTFAPTVGGQVNGAITFTHNSTGSPTSVVVNGVGIAPGFDPQPVSLTFGNVVVGGTKRDSIIVTNNGTASLNVTSISSTNPRFTSLTTPFTLGQGLSRSVLFVFSPSAPGLQSGDIIFSHNASGSPDSVHVAGTGVAPQWSVSPQSIGFGNTQVNSSKKDSVTVTNRGTSALTISSVVSTDPSFSANPVLATIAPLDSVKIYVTFVPTSAGLKGASIVFTHDAAGSPDTVTASGTGVIAGFSASPSVVSFGTVLIGTTKQDSIRVTNSGTSPLDISQVTSSNLLFSINPTSAAIPPGQTRRFDVAFSPTAFGPSNADFVFVHNGTTVRDTVRASGVGVAPGLLVIPRPLSFPAVGLGSSLDATIKLINSGSASLHIDSARIRGTHATDYAIVGSGGPFPPIAPSDSIAMTIRFTPQDSTSRSAMLIISSDASTSPDSVPMTGRGRPSLIRVTLNGDTTAGNPLNMSVTPPGGSVVDSAKLYFRNAGKQPFDSLVLNQSGTVYVGSFPPGVINARGIEYYILFFTAQGRPSFPENNPSIRPAVVRVKVANLQSSLAFKRRMYKMISVPLELNDATVPSVLYDDYNPYDRSRWRLFRWEGGDYVEHPSISGTFTPGTSFWLITQSGFGFDADNGRSVNSASPQQITIPVGWSQIACPYIFPVAWDSVLNGQSVQGPFYYDNGEYVPNVRVLRPWEGYFVRNDSTRPITLSIPPVEAPPSITLFDEQSLLHGVDDFILKLSASTSEGLNDSYNYIGLVNGAGSSRDNMDIAEPPTIGDFVSLSVVEEGHRFVGKFKAHGESGQRWDIELSSTLDRPVVSIRLQQMGNLPDGFHVYVFDRDDLNAIGIVDNQFSVRLAGSGSLRRMLVVVGTEQYALEQSGGIPLIPIAYALAQNYPNPFNPTTTIGYQLQKRSEVKLEIYNLLGQRVRVLVNAEQGTGTYSVMWDGRNEHGVNSPSGVYIYRLQAGDFVAGKKLLLLK